MDAKLERFIINENMTLTEAMKRLDETAEKVLFVADGNTLLAALSDGDIRRWLLAGGTLDAAVKKIANYSPFSLPEEEKYRAGEYLRRRKITAVPIVDGQSGIVDICFRDGTDKELSSEPLRLPVVIMAGGLGTRLYPYTKILPKPLIPVGDIPITEHIINLFRRFGCDDFYLIVNHKKNMIKAYFNETEKDYRVSFVDEELPLGTGGGVGLLKGIIDTTFILTNCDTLITEDFSKIVRQHREAGNAVTMICSLKDFQVPYGVVELGSRGEIAAMREKPSYSFFTNTGTYIVEPEIIAAVEDNTNISFPDIMGRAKEKGLKIGAYPISADSWMDMGQPDELEKMRLRLCGE